jgi:hypothetical protein
MPATFRIMGCDKNYPYPFRITINNMADINEYTMNFRIILSVTVILLLLVGAGCLQERRSPGGASTSIAVNATEATPQQIEMVLLLNNVTNETVQALTGIDQATSNAAIALGRNGISGPEASAVLERAMASGPAVLTVITIDTDGTVLSAEPESATVIVGQDIGDQDVVCQALTTRQPLMSGLFPLAQGGDAVVIEYPVFASGGHFTGVVSTAFSPYRLVAPIAANATAGTPYSFMVAQTDGRVLYDSDFQEVGKETFNETLYAEFPEILEFARQYAGNSSGYATYSFCSTGFRKIVHKEAFWTTAGLHETEWRVIVIGEV